MAEEGKSQARSLKPLVHSLFLAAICGGVLFLYSMVKSGGDWGRSIRGFVLTAIVFLAVRYALERRNTRKRQ